MAFFRRPALAAAAAVFALAVTGCGGGTTAASGRAAAARAQNQLVPEVRALYLKMYHAHFAWAGGGSMSGEYQGCPTSSQPNELAYYGFIDALISFDHHIDSATYGQQAIALARAAGWKYSHQEPAGNGFVNYFFTKDGITLRLAIRVNKKKTGGSSVVTSWGPCFDAGPAAAALNSSAHQRAFPLPYPSPSPSS